MIYVLVPAYNEAPTVGLLLWKVRQLFTSFSREYQLIVVNDGSTDATEEILAPYTRALPLTLLTHKKRKGYARSLEALLREAVKRTDRPRRDMAVTLQADFSESPDDVLELIKRLEGGADMVIADRRARPGASRRERLVRRLLPRLVKKKLGINGADDVVGTMRGYRLATIERLVKDAGPRPFLGQDGWAADLELLARLSRHARRIDSVPIASERPDSARASRLSPLREAWRAFRAASALKGLPMPTLEAGEPAEATKHDHTAQRQERHERGERGERGHRGERGEKAGRGEHRGHPRRPAREGRERAERGDRQRHVARQKADHRPKLEVATGENAPAKPEAAAAPAEGGARRKRRRRGRGRGRGPRGPGQQGQQNPQAAEPPPSPPAA